MRGERREGDRENECVIAMARKQREKDPRPRPQPPRTSQARRVAGIIVGPGSVVPGPLEPSLSRDRSRTSERFEILAGRSRASVGPFTWKGAQSHFVIFMDLDRNCYCKPVARDLFFIFCGSSQELILQTCRARPVFHVLWILAGIDTVNLSRATCFVIVLSLY